MNRQPAPTNPKTTHNRPLTYEEISLLRNATYDATGIDRVAVLERLQARLARTRLLIGRRERSRDVDMHVDTEAVAAAATHAWLWARQARRLLAGNPATGGGGPAVA